MERLVIVTGASRGIGAEIALEANRRFSRARFLLIARDEKQLEAVKAKMTNSENSSVILRIDFSQEAKVDDYADLLRKSVVGDENNMLPRLKELYVFYNHGTLRAGTVEQIAESAHQEFLINVSNVWLFLASVRKVFPVEAVPTQFHINISSLLATQTAPMMSTYCACIFIFIAFNKF